MDKTETRDARSQPDIAPVKCAGCGQFVSLADTQSGAAKFYFEPDNHYGPERCEWTCAKCVSSMI